MAQPHAVRRRRSWAWTALALVGIIGALVALRWSDIKLRYTVYKLRTGHEGEQVDAQAQLEAHLGKRCLPLFRQLLDDPHPRVRYLAVDTLGRLGEEKDFRLLARALGDCDSEVRVRAVQLMPRWKGQRTRAVLAALLRDSDAELRAETAQRLGELGDKSVAPALIAALEDADESVVSFAVGSLRRLTGQRFGYKHVAPRAAKQKALARWRQWAASEGLVPALPPPPADLAPLMTPRRMPAPDFSISGGKGGSLRLSNFQGKVLLLNFFSPG